VPRSFTAEVVTREFKKCRQDRWWRATGIAHQRQRTLYRATSRTFDRATGEQDVLSGVFRRY